MKADCSGVLIPLILAGVTGCAGAPRIQEAELPSTGRVTEPDLAALPDGRLVATWALVDAEGSADVVMSVLDPRQGDRGPLRRVNPVPGSAVAGQQVGPRVATGPGGTIVIVWVDRERDPAGDILLSVSRDAGRTLSTPRRLNDDPLLETGQEYHDVAVTPDGTILVVWLDERDAPAEYENQKQLYFSVSKDGGRSFSGNRALTRSPRGVCPCCRPSLAASRDGSVHVIYRDRENDLLFIRTRSLHAGDDQFSEAFTLSDGWRFPGCPVNGPAIETGPEGKVWALWVEDGQLRWGRSSDHGASFAESGTVPSHETGFAAAASHLSLASSPDLGTFAAWENGAGQVCFAALPLTGERPGSLPVVVAGTEGTFAGSPTIESSGGNVYVCWHEDTVGFASDGPRPLPRLAVLEPSSEGCGAGVLTPIAFNEEE